MSEILQDNHEKLVGFRVTESIASANMFLIALSFLPLFGGSAKEEGLFDKFFGQLRFGGFRSDVVWLGVSSIVFMFGFLALISEARTNRDARICAYFCFAEFALFLCYIVFTLLSGTLDFG